MRSASSTAKLSFGFAVMLLATSISAAPTISDWSVKADGSSQKVQLQWSETGSIEMNEFAQARQVTAVLPGASLKQGTATRLDTGRDGVIERARLQEVTLPDGSKGVQLTIDLREWTEMEKLSTDQGLTLSFSVPDKMKAQPVATGDGLTFTDDKVEQMLARGFGDANAPETGAGQAPATEISEYFVPPQVDHGMSSGGSGQSMNQIEVQSKLNQLVRRVDFQGTSLENVLRLISEEAELNIMITPSDVANSFVTLRLRNVTLRQMLEAILKANDLGYTIEDGGIVRVVPREQVKSTLRETSTIPIPISWIDARDVADALEPFVDPDEGTIEVSESTNTLIIRDVPETVQEIQSLVAQLDVPERQVLIEMRLINMTESAQRAFGVRTGAESQSTNTRFARDGNASFFDNSAYANRNMNVTNTQTGSTENTFEDEFENFVGGAFGGSQSYDSSVESGTDFSSSSSSSMFETPSTRAAAGLLDPGATAFQYTTGFTADVFGTKYDVDLALNAQEDRGEAVTLANPTVLSLNNQEATVEIKRQIPYLSGVNTDQGSIATIEFVDVGTQVLILPRITNNGYVIMEIEPEQIIDTGERVQPNNVPVTDERRVKASVIVRDQNTVALGGLREFVATSSESGVPFLLRLPVLSWLFKSQSNSQDKTELYLFVSPQIVRDMTPTPYQMSIYEKIDYNWDLPDYFYDEVFARKAPGERENPNIKNK